MVNVFSLRMSRGEHFTYVALWTLIFAAPLMSLYVRMAAGHATEFNWSEVLLVWRQYAVFLALFVVHNFLMAPLLVYRQKRWLYLSLVAMMLAAFVVCQCTMRPQEPRPLEMHHRHDVPPPPLPPDEEHYEMEPPAISPAGHEQRHVPPAIIGEHDVVSVIVLILMLGMNIGVKLYFKTANDQRRFLALEREHLEQQLQYLKYQINPHFLMNTLNNIHALVDIDPEKSKETILQLSRMMRYLLYETDKALVPVAREFDFLQHYISLMRLRYTEQVDITLSLPADVPDRTIPPLLLITFVENAFKHGISYQQQSFVNIEASVDADTLHFTCRNSKPVQQARRDGKGGVGLANARQRLTLLFGHRYTLNISDKDTTYNVELTIPLRT